MNYGFIERDGEAAVSLNTVDELACEIVGIDCSEQRYSRAYNNAVLIGMSVCLSSNSSRVAPEALEKWMSENDDCHAHLTEWELTAIAEILCGKLIFHTWR